MFLEKVIMYVLACVNIYTNVFGTKLANLNLPFIFKKKEEKVTKFRTWSTTSFRPVQMDCLF